MRSLRVSHIASMAWCQVKAKALFDGAEPPPTPESERGRIMHALLGFDENVPVRGEYGGYAITGHIDRIVTSGGCKTVYELKTHGGTYPLNFLVAPAHLQANLYAYFSRADYYVVLVYFLDNESFWGAKAKADPRRAEEDLAKAVSIAEGTVEPVPTGYAWKCSACFLADRCQKSPQREGGA
ncbi:MAG: PD-(D/E)XK nuclease family protein [Candidatus Methanomethyliales bacterium]|nr:PD-(D/E)XK nuclease family protein [Candidatus Bipolaricaulota bacterium]MBC7113213.1 PD-(D/E)XK nuclease family protein [Candidatus Methanomethylicales archaeon]